MLRFGLATQINSVSGKSYSYFYIAEGGEPAKWLLDCGHMISDPDWRQTFQNARSVLHDET